jgi:hypothetical protein
MKNIAAHYQTIVKYLKWDNADILPAMGCGSRSDIEGTNFPARTYQMGNTLRT